MNGGDGFAACLMVLALWVLLSGLDDLFLQLALLFRRPAGLPRWPSEAQLERAHPKRIAIFVPLWHEQRVIERMLDHNLAAAAYEHFDFFVGVYPNDPATSAAVWEVARRFSNVHVACCPHPGPTSKADCLNWIYQSMLLWEEEHGERFEVVVTHDAEDLIHPQSLRLINYFTGYYDMVQVPVLPLPTPLAEWTHGLYCDEFAEYQSKDILVRQALGGFLASNGVGTGFTRAALEELAKKHSNRIFEPACLTEDYDAGFRIHRLGRKQMFLPLRAGAAGFVATREYFPRDFRAAIRQRTRWVTGIALQGWERHGWRAPAGQLYWLWRDRKGLAGNLLSPITNLLFVWGMTGWVAGTCAGCGWGEWLWQSPLLVYASGAALVLAAAQLGFRTAAAARVYGWRFASGAPLRAVWGNWLNGIATALALWNYFGAKLSGRPLVWLKTEHIYPSRVALMAHKRPLGEVLLAQGAVTAADLRQALAVRSPGERIGECLLRLGGITEDALYRALSAQQSLPLAKPAGRALAALPASVARKWGIVPLEVLPGKLLVAGPEIPTDEMTDELERYCRAEVRFQLVTPTDFRRLARGYLS